VTSRGSEQKDIFRNLKDRGLPALLELTGRASLDEIVKAVRNGFPGDDRQATKAGITMGHCYTGAKLKEIGELFRLTESGVTRASKRFEQAMERDTGLKESLIEIRARLRLSIA